MYLVRSLQCIAGVKPQAALLRTDDMSAVAAASSACSELSSFQLRGMIAVTRCTSLPLHFLDITHTYALGAAVTGSVVDTAATGVFPANSRYDAVSLLVNEC